MKTLFRLRYDSRWGEELFLTGNTNELGLWNPNKAVEMEYVGPGIWSVSIDTNEGDETHGRASQPTEYKYFPEMQLLHQSLMGVKAIRPRT